MPTANELFLTYFWPHYPPDVQARLDYFRTLDANPSNNPHLLQHLTDAAEIFRTNAAQLLGVTLDYSGDSVALLSSKLTKPLRDQLLQQSQAHDPSNVLFNFVVHASAFIGTVAVRKYGAHWSLRRPMWESLVVRQRFANDTTATAIAPFHWLLKHLSDQELELQSLAYRFRIHIEQASADIDQLPVIIPPKKLPAIHSVTYDLLVKYLQHHLAPLRDLGLGFPSPKEFATKQFARLEFQLLHGGRILVVHGFTQQNTQPSLGPTVEVYWFTLSGLDHIDALPADVTPPYFARVLNDQLLEFTVAWRGQPHIHRIGFRGHQ